MKAIPFIIVFFLLPLFSHEQTILKYPNIGYSNTESIVISQIEINKTETILSFETNMPEGSRFGISSKSYIKVVGSQDPLFLVKKKAPSPVNGWITIPKEGIKYKLYFPPIDPSTIKIDFGEIHSGAWFIYDVEINPEPLESEVPNELAGHWFSVDSGKWAFSFLNSSAIFRNKTWYYVSAQKRTDDYEIILADNGGQLKVFYKQKDNDQILVSFENDKEFMPYSKDARLLVKTLDTKTEWVNSRDSDVFIYSGMIKGFRPEFGNNGFIETGNGAKGVRYSFGEERNFKVFKIDERGRFSVSIKTDKPQEALVRLPLRNEKIFLIPGKNLFHLVNTGIKEFPSLFMDECSDVSLRLNLINTWSKDYHVQNRYTELNEKEYQNLIFKASYQELEQFKKPQFKNLRQKSNLFFIPRRTFYHTSSLGIGAASTDSFWISNEITNKEYWEFASDILNHPDNILQWSIIERNKVGRGNDTIREAKVYSEIAKKLVDSAYVVNVAIKGTTAKIGITEYLTKKEYRDYPAIVPFEGVDYYVIWLNQKNSLNENDTYYLTSDIIYLNLEDYKSEIKNYKDTVLELDGIMKVPSDTLSFLFSNVPEWYNRPSYSLTNPEPIKAIIHSRADLENPVELDPEELASKSAGFRLIKYARIQEPDAKASRQNLKNISILFGIILSTLIIVFFIWRLRNKWKLKQETKKRRLRELELTAIRSQMNPHFLFNSLNSVQNLIQQNKGREAHLYLSDFAGLIRKVLQNSGKEEVSLAVELEMVEQYLNLEKLRFDFDFSIRCDEAIDTQNTMIPPLLIQPFAENAVIHGLQNKPADRKLLIQVSKLADGIKITIEDNGIGREAARQIKSETNGKGIRMNAERLNLLCEKQGEKYSLKITDLEQGTRVEIMIPEEN